MIEQRSNYLSKTLPILTLCLIIALVLSCKPSSETFVILHSNDIHGTFQPYKLQVDDTTRLVGGMEAASHYIKQIKAQEENVLIIDTGDIMTGTLAALMEYRGVLGGVMPEFLNRLGYDIRCHGNHAFDLGHENAKGIEKLTKFPMIMANLVYKNGGGLVAAAPYHILTKGSLSIGVIAVMEEIFLVEVSKENVEMFEVLPMISTLNSYVPELEEKSDLIVVMFHGGFKEGKDAAMSVPGVDVILVASEDGNFEKVNGVLVKSTIGHQKTFGYLKLYARNGKIVNFEQDLIWLWADVDLKPSPEVQKLVKEVEDSIESEFSEFVGRADFHYKCPGYDSIENALGNWVTDVMRWKTGAQIGIHNSGAIRADIYAGPISKNDIFKVAPFGNTLISFEMSGKQLKQALETDVERARDRVQVSGLKYKYYPKEARPFGERVNFIQVNGDTVVEDGRILLPGKMFSVVSNDYLVGQAKKKYFGFEVTQFKNTHLLLEKVLVEWLEKNEVLACSIQDRIVELKVSHE